MMLSNYSIVTRYGAKASSLWFDRMLRFCTSIILGTLLLTAASRVVVPMIWVPMTLQPYAVLLISVLYGPRLSVLTLLAYLFEGIIGWPVWAGGASGIGSLLGPTGGYLMSFPLAAAVVGWLVERGWMTSAIKAFVTLLLGHIIIFTLGIAWLAMQIGLIPAIVTGLYPFFLSTLLQIIFVMTTLRLIVGHLSLPY